MSRYDEVMRQRAMNAHNATGTGVQDFSGPLAPGVGRDAIDASVKKGATDLQNNAIKGAAPDLSGGATAALSSQGAQQAVQAAGQGNQMGTLGGGLMAAGAIPSPASPYLMAAGLGLQVLGAGEQNKRAEEEAQRVAYNEKIKARQQAMSQIASMGIQ